MTAAEPFLPESFSVVANDVETADVVTLRVRPCDGGVRPFRPAQFSMIGVVGVGEVPISISSRVDRPEEHAYTIRRAGAVTEALAARRAGDVVTIRGPFGQGWDLERARGRHAVFVAGGIGLAPLSAAVEELTDGAGSGAASVTVLVGAKHPADVLSPSWLDDLRRRGVRVEVTVDAQGAAEWSGHLGLVTALIPAAVDDPDRVEAYVCGPDVMMVATIDELVGCGVAADRIEITLERNMQCANGWCGHCQLGPLLVCRDGPVVRADRVGRLLSRSEL